MTQTPLEGEFAIKHIVSPNSTRKWLSLLHHCPSLLSVSRCGYVSCHLRTTLNRAVLHFLFRKGEFGSYHNTLNCLK